MSVPIVLVTGSTHGIGRAIAEALAACGCTVIRHGSKEADFAEPGAPQPADDEEIRRTA